MGRRVTGIVRPVDPAKRGVKRLRSGSSPIAGRMSRCERWTMKPDLDAAIDAAIRRDLRNDHVVAGSLEVVREKHVGDDVVVAVTFRQDKKADARRSCLGLAWSERDGWRAVGGAWTSTFVDRAPQGVWLNWGGWGPGSGGGLHVLSGWLADPRAASVLVTDGVSRQLEDRVENGVAILTWRGGFSPERATVELHDSAGDVLASEPLQPRRD